MKRVSQIFQNGKTDYEFNATFEDLNKNANGQKIIVITDENIFRLQQQRLKDFTCLVIPPGENHKTQSTVTSILQGLLKAEADKSTVLVGLGGGVVTDMAGFAASIYKRGIPLILAPTSLLAMVDAAIGGKNGINLGKFKNMAGTIYPPAKIIFDYSFLKTLPKEEWVNGFAEIIKHACIQSASLFEFLEQHCLEDFIADANRTAALIEQNVQIKTQIVLEDEREEHKRKLLNFGHSIGHAIESSLHIPHGHAISIGMVWAARFSEEINMFYSAERERLVKLLIKYGLPVNAGFNKAEIWEKLIMDKKRQQDNIDFILLDKIGEGRVQKIPLVQLKDMLETF